MTIDNFELIKPLLRFDKQGDFYFVQLLKRRKENPDLHKDVKYIKDFFIYSLHDLERNEEWIKKLCSDNNARAYLRLNKRNAERVGLVALNILSVKLLDKEYKSLSSIYTQAAGKRYKSDNSSWLIDLDDKDESGSLERAIITYLTNNVRPYGKKHIATIPTLNGKHLITKRFDVNEFKKQFDMDVHKENPTLLYYTSIA